MEKLQLLCTAGGNEMVQLLWKTVKQFHKKKSDIPYAPAIPLLDTDPKGLKAGTHTAICTPTVRAASFSIAKELKQPEYPYIDEWIKKI